MRTLQRLSLLLLTFSFLVGLHAQPIDLVIPDQYQNAASQKVLAKLAKEIEQATKQQSRELKKFDEPVILIPPTEQVSLSLADLNLANSPGWHLDWTDVTDEEIRLADAIEATGVKFGILAILDTGEPIVEQLRQYLLPVPGDKTNYTPDRSVEDKNSHSTHIAGMIAAEQWGLLRELCRRGLLKLYFKKVCTDNGSCPQSAIADAIADLPKDLGPWLDADHPVEVNLSIGGGFMQPVEDALQQAAAAGIGISAANGNNGRPQVSYPGSSQWTAGIAAINSSGQVASWSNWGPETTFSGTGVMITSLCPNGQPCVKSGTSMACPQAAALRLAMRMFFAQDGKPATVPAVTSWLQEHNFDLGETGFDYKYGWGASQLTKLLAAPPLDPDNPPDGPDEPGDDDDEPDNPAPPIDCPIGAEQIYPLAYEQPLTMRFLLLGTSEVNATSQDTAWLREISQLSRVQTNRLITMTIPGVAAQVTSKLPESCANKAFRANIEDYANRYVIAVREGTAANRMLYYFTHFADMMALRNLAGPSDFKFERIEMRGELAGEQIAVWLPRELTSNWPDRQIPTWPADQLARFRADLYWQTEVESTGPGLPDRIYADFIFSQAVEFLAPTGDIEAGLQKLQPPVPGYQLVSYHNLERQNKFSNWQKVE